MPCDVTHSEIQLFGLFTLCSPCHLPRVFAANSTVLVCVRTSTVYFTGSLNMEKILQNIVKIIIVGVLYVVNVSCSRQYLPPLPYYHNDPYYVSGFVNPYQEYVPVFIQPNVPPPPPPISYQNGNTYTRQFSPQNNNYHSQQLFYKNENYHPLPPPGVNYPVTPFASHSHNYKAPYMAQQKASYEISQKQNLQETKHPQTDQEKLQVYTPNIILKDETYSPYYQDEYNKNYHEDDYTDNYTDDSPEQNDPCKINPSYKNFEPGPSSYRPSGRDKYTLCNPYFQPNFGNSVYTVKAPITLLPSRFPPRVEEFVQRIQNYFSTYTEKETPKPENQTSTTVSPMNEISASVSSTNEVAGENQTQAENAIKTNATEIQQLEPSPLTNQANETEKVTIELEFVGKKTPIDMLETKIQTTKIAEILTTTEESSAVQESTIKSPTVLGESSVPEITSTLKSASEPTTEARNDATPTNEVLLEVTDTNG